MRHCTRWTAIILCLIFLLSTLVPLLGCSNEPPQNNEGGGQTGEGNTGGNTKPTGGIITPPYKEYPDRRTVKYADMTYSRPDFDTIIATFSDTVSLIEKNEVPYSEQLLAIEALGEPYECIQTNYALIETKKMQNSLDKTVADEYSFMLTSYPLFAGEVEKLFVACARSPYARDFEKDYFKDDISEYEDGGRLTDEVVSLLATEGELEASYSTLSSTEVFEYKNEVGTYDDFKKKIDEKYAGMPNSAQHFSELTMLELAYKEQIQEPINNLYVELVRVRRQIADALGDENYLYFAYGENGYEYTVKNMQCLLNRIKSYVAPIYWDDTFYSAYSIKMQSLEYTRPSRTEIINSLYTTYMLTDAELGDIYAYMLQFGLYDIERQSSERFEGAFTTYFEGYDAPFLFATLTQTNSDYLTVSHEFGHFADCFVNGNSSASLDLKEVYSQGLELLTTHHTNKSLPKDVTIFLKYQALYNAIQTLMIQGYYAEVELRVYALPYEEITKDNISAITREVAAEYGFGNAPSFDISTVIMTHTVLYPTYVQSYCTSVLSALELYMLEADESGKGLLAYKTLLHSDSSLSYIEAIEGAGLTSPFATDLVRDLMDDVYYEFLGRHYFSVCSDKNVA